MKLRQLIYNSEFNFNAEFKLVEYDYKNDTEKVLYDSRVSPNDPDKYYDWWITSINQDEDGTISIDIDSF